MSEVYKYGNTGYPICVDGLYLCTTITPSGKLSVFQTGSTGRSIHVDDAGRLVITINPEDLSKYNMQSFTDQADGVQNTFILDHEPILNTVNVHLNGILLDVSNGEYVIVNKHLIMGVVPKKTDSLRVEYFYK